MPRTLVADQRSSLHTQAMAFTHLPRIALAQFEVKTGQPNRNVECMLEMIGQARQREVEIIAFPELCISGYILGDLWEIDTLVDDFAAWSECLREASSDICVIFGNVVVDRRSMGEDGRVRKFNAVRVCHNEQWLGRHSEPPGLPPGTQPKTLHPNYRFFDDERHFYSLRKLAMTLGVSIENWMLPFAVTASNGEIFRFGVQLCEDLWSADYSYHDEALDTLHLLYQTGAQAVFNLSASPWSWQKNEKRHRTVRAALNRAPIPFFYVNQVGAQNNGKNIIVFDGHTSAYAADGRIAALAPAWEEHLLVIQDPPPPQPSQSEEMALIDKALITGLKHLDHLRGSANRFLVGVSGGIDSSVSLCELVRAFGPERVFALNLPTQFNAPITQNNARTLCQKLGVDYLNLSIQDIYQLVRTKIIGAEFPHETGHYTDLVDENIQARIRGADILAGLAAKYGLLYSNNGNKTEVALGYATLYGDVNGAIAPLADLYKVQIFALARYLNETIYQDEIIPENLYDGTTVPSAELSDAQAVEQGLGDPIKYGYHDAVLRRLIEYRQHPMDLLRAYCERRLFAELDWFDVKKFREYFPTSADWVDDLEWLAQQLRINYFKRIQAPPIIVLSKRAFGFDLRESQLPQYLPQTYPMWRERALVTPVP